MSDQMEWPFVVETRNGRRRARVYVSGHHVMLHIPPADPVVLPAVSDQAVSEAIESARRVANQTGMDL